MKVREQARQRSGQAAEGGLDAVAGGRGGGRAAAGAGRCGQSARAKAKVAVTGVLFFLPTKI